VTQSDSEEIHLTTSESGIDVAGSSTPGIVDDDGCGDGDASQEQTDEWDVYFKGLG
jgi:hypothetical protein